MGQLSPTVIAYLQSVNAPKFVLKLPEYDKAQADMRRQRFLTTKHSLEEKIQLYTCSTKGQLDELKQHLSGTSEG